MHVNLEQSIRRQKSAQCSSSPYSNTQVLKKKMRQLTARAFTAHGKGKFLKKIVAHLSVAANESSNENIHTQKCKANLQSNF